MPKYSQQSSVNLNKCHPFIRDVMNTVITTFDVSITESYRGKDEQNRAYNDGLSQLRYPDSKHNTMPCEAFHALPYPFHGWDNTAQFTYMAGYIIAIADRISRERYNDRYALRWGGNWDMDSEVITDQDFDDLAHFELTHNEKGES